MSIIKELKELEESERFDVIRILDSTKTLPRMDLNFLKSYIYYFVELLILYDLGLLEQITIKDFLATFVEKQKTDKATEEIIISILIAKDEDDFLLMLYKLASSQKYDEINKKIFKPIWLALKWLYSIGGLPLASEDGMNHDLVYFCHVLTQHFEWPELESTLFSSMSPPEGDILLQNIESYLKMDPDS